MASAEIWVERTRPKPRAYFNLRAYLNRLQVTPVADAPGSPGIALEMVVWVTPNGTGRPDEIAHLLGLTPLLEDGAYFERITLELYDEVPADDLEIVPSCLLEKPRAACGLALDIARPQAVDEGVGQEPVLSGPKTNHSTLRKVFMKKEMLINVLQPEEIRIAIVEDGVLEELYVERTSHESYVGNIYKGRIVNIEPSIQAAFRRFWRGPQRATSCTCPTSSRPTIATSNRVAAADRGSRSRRRPRPWRRPAW